MLKNDNKNIENENNEEEDLIESTGFKALKYSNLIDRYFTKFYINQGKDNEQYVFIHTNG